MIREADIDGDCQVNYEGEWTRGEGGGGWEERKERRRSGRRRRQARDGKEKGWTR